MGWPWVEGVVLPRSFSLTRHIAHAGCLMCPFPHHFAPVMPRSLQGVLPGAEGPREGVWLRARNHHALVAVGSYCWPGYFLSDNGVGVGSVTRQLQ
jgi:hypothetical protein